MEYQYPGRRVRRGNRRVEGVVRVPRQVFRRFIDGAVTPERCLEAYHLYRTRLEMVVERKLRNRQLTDDGNVEINGRDLRVLLNAGDISAGHNNHVDGCG